jgi:dolichol-phosphate mannosyltransferase
MPLQVWVQAVRHGLTIVEVPVPLIYLDEERAFGGALDDSTYRLNHYRRVFQEALQRSGLEVAGGCRG